MKLPPSSGGYKIISRERELRRIHTHSPHTMCIKDLEPWSPQWVRQKLREANNDLPPNNPNHDEKPPINAERPLCKCVLDCQSHKSLERVMYVIKYLSCPLLTSPFNWGWDEEKLRKVVSVVTFTL
jgi:hypothetical protein